MHNGRHPTDEDGAAAMLYTEKKGSGNCAQQFIELGDEENERRAVLRSTSNALQTGQKRLTNGENTVHHCAINTGLIHPDCSCLDESAYTAREGSGICGQGIVELGQDKNERRIVPSSTSDTQQTGLKRLTNGENIVHHSCSNTGLIYPDCSGHYENAYTARKGSDICGQGIIELGQDKNERRVVRSSTSDTQQTGEKRLTNGGDIVNHSSLNAGLIRQDSSGHYESAYRLMRMGADVNAIDREGNTALIRAARDGHHENVKVLIESGADTNVMSYTGKTPLVEAVKGGHEKCVGFLIIAGADVNFTDVSGSKPLILAIDVGNPKIVELILEAGADVNTTNSFHETAWHQVIENGLVDMLVPFLKAKADVNRTDKAYDAPLVRFIRRNEMVGAEILIQAGADVNIKCIDGQPVIMEAAAHGNLKAVQILIKGGVNVNVTHNYNSTVLMKAAQGGHDKCVEALIQAGADVNTKHNNGTTALMNACKTVMFKGTRESERLRCAKLLIDAGAHVNARTIHGYTALIHAAENDSTEIVATLIKSGADVNSFTNTGFTALMFAAISGNIKLGYHGQAFDFSKSGINTSKLLLRAGARVNKANRDGHNALQCHIIECEKINEELSMLLFAAGETVNVSHIERMDHIGQVKSVPVPVLFRQEKELSEIHLMSMCRESIRNYLLKTNPTVHLFHTIHKLGLPTTLTKYLLYNMSLDMENDYGISFDVHFKETYDDHEEEHDDYDDDYYSEDYTDDYTETEEDGNDVDEMTTQLKNLP